MNTEKIFSSIQSRFSALQTKENDARTRAYNFQSNIVREPEIEEERPNLLIKMEKIRRKIKAIENREARYIAFKKQLKEGVGLLLPDVYDIKDLKKPWRTLDNDQRNNRLIDYLDRNYEGKEREELMTLLIPEIPNRLLQKFAVDWDEENAKLLALPCVQVRTYPDGTKAFYFAG